MLVISLILFAIGMVWLLKLRGKTSRRSGAQVGAELLAEKMARQSLPDGKTSLARKTWFWGKGWAVEREMSFSYAEIKILWRESAFGALLPFMLFAVGMLGVMFLGGLLMLLTLPSRIPGAIILVAGVYGTWLIVTGILKA
jgi:hypothetical protein